ncbi:hypothetical protein [Snuella sedimenti]|uniref:Cupin domain-containing protein n=1 Tax=Snuella sedimenti TaxID=2798802 RepID=A0A8J7LSR5_9FLAO|nr:hypothetical protein [Snuella sedimenti]MBJ6367476.1 hypothetical protein [Snuella sedimenti]
MKTIEAYRIKEEGYHPFLIREGWQVAQLNYVDTYEIKNIDKLDIHHHTDEVFILLKGKAVLIGARFIENSPVFEMELMKPNITYNVPQNTWHNIAMEEGSEVIIIEKSNTHLTDFEFHYLTAEEREALIELVTQLLNVV